MYKITEKVALNPTVTKMVIEAPLIAKKAKPGQFIIVRPFEDSERIPLTVAGYDREKGTVDIIFQIVGGTTMELNSLNAGDSVHDFVGPLGRATETEGLKKVCVVGGGVGCAIALPIAKELHDQGCTVHSVIGFRNKDLLILEDEFNACSDELRIMTDDGSYGTKGVVTAALVRRQPPHMPVPSIIMGFMETMLLRPCFWQVLTTNFIMMSGPMVMTRSYWLPEATSSSRAAVTTPLVP